MKNSDSENIAIIGMAGRFPGAADVDEFWRNLVGGKESISTFTDEELSASGFDVAKLRKDPHFVATRGFLPEADFFDATFFGISAKEAEVTDPQQRLFLETSWHALENAGYDPEQVDGLIGVYAGVGINTYNFNNIRSNAQLVDLVGEEMIVLGNEKDYLATRIAYKLNLKGPALNVNTACSTSLVAVCQASQALLNYQCDLALAGGISVTFPQKRGVIYQEGSIFSPDGHSRVFDAKAKGTVFSDALGVVVLKRLSEAMEDGDQIYAVIKGCALNNDGAAKVGFTAPSVDGQADAITLAQADAGIDPATISYVECHGTATPIGDPIEIAALTQAFRARTKEKNFCAIGSVKSNVGHSGSAAGVTSLIKTVLSLKNQKLPPSLNFSEPNPKIDFADSPFFVNSKLTEWKAGSTPRRAGVSSFGFGGTNAHVVLEEAPEPEPSSSCREWQVLLLSAKSGAALDAATTNLYEYLNANPEVNLADAAYTLQVGRRTFDHRRMVVCRDVDDAIQALKTRDPKRIMTHAGDVETPSVVFMFPGQGSQYVNMGADLYRTETVFKEEVDRCSEILRPTLGMDLREVLYPAAGKEKAAEELLTQTRMTQAALFTIEFALATLWMSWGIKPAALIGHSIGEYVAACLSGVFSLEDALALVAQRGQLIQNMPRGTMLAVPLPEDELLKILPATLSLAAVNGPAHCVVSGPTAEIDAFLEALTTSGKTGRILHTSHAFHSKMMEPVLQPFAEAVKRTKRGEPKIPFLSNLTGTWISAEDASDPQYWARHLRSTVRFADGIKEILKNETAVLLEVGPGTTLSSLTRLQTKNLPNRAVISSLRHAREEQSDGPTVLTALGQLFLRGTKVDWEGFYAQEKRQRISLPGYAFQRERYWIESKPPGSTPHSLPRLSGKKPDIADWFYVPTWKRSAPLQPIHAPPPSQNWLVFVDKCELGHGIVEKLEPFSENVTKVRAGKNFEAASDGSFALNPALPADYEKLLNALEQKKKLPQRIVHLWSVTRETATPVSEADSFSEQRNLGFDSLIFLAQAFSKRGISDVIPISLISNQMQAVVDGEIVSPGKSIILGPGKVVSQEFSHLPCRNIDVVPGEAGSAARTRLIGQLAAELLSNESEPVVAYRGGYRWIPGFEPIRLGESTGAKNQLKPNGVYLITGGFGKIGLALAEFLAKNYRARLILLGRTVPPPKPDWEAWLASHGPEDHTSLIIRKIRAMEAMGSEVMILGADVADKKQLSAGISAAHQRFGMINGVFHGAGVADRGGFTFIPDITRTQADLHFQAKVHGLITLENVLKDAKLDFVILISSLATVLGGLGTAAYSGANHFMDAFALSRNRSRGTRWISMRLDRWRDAKETESATVAAKNAEFGLSPEEGVEIFRRILGEVECNEIVISTVDLDSRIDQWIKPHPSEDENSSKLRELPKPEVLPSHARPEMRTDYAPAKNETEKKLAAIWQELLGIENVGIHDNFFDLGGDSLLLMRVQVKIREVLHNDLSPAEMFEFPTISGLARRLSQTGAESPSLGAVQSRAQLQRAALERQRQTIKQS